MNRLLKYYVVFVLPFLFLFINVSYCSIVTNKTYTYSGRATPSSNITDPLSYIGYSEEDLSLYFSNYLNNGDSTLINIMLDLDYVTYYYVHNSSDNSYYLHFFHSDYDVGYCFENDSAKYFVYSPIVQRDMYSFRMLDGEFKFLYTPAVRLTTNEYSMKSFYPGDAYYTTYLKSEKPIKFLNSTSTNKYTWDGTTYYENPKEDTFSPPSNSEIASAVQAFYNSDYYKNNKDFSDFIVMYNYNTKYFDFIGHNHGIDLGQVIVPADYTYENVIYNQPWWKFFLRNISSEIASNLWNRYYWLYSTNDFGANLTYEGKGVITDLINLHFSTSSIIVYSTTDYPVVKIETNEETGVLEPVEGTIPGDQYTYDETLDPTTNQYDPLTNFVPTNPTENILGNVDFDEINKVFEENKNILNIENASWLYTANNQLINYFIGFLSFLIVLIIISRILGG